MKLGPVTPKFSITTAVADHSQTQYERRTSGRPKCAANPIRATRRAVLGLAAAALSLFLCGSVRAGQSASVAWTPSPGVTGYAFYLGTNHGAYNMRLDVGTNTTITLTGLAEGQTRYFAVSSYNSARMESAVSTEVAYLVPGLARVTPPTRPGNPATVSFPVAVGHIYSIQASTDLKTWTTVFTTLSATNNAWTSWQDPQTSSFAKRFYRLIMN